MMKVVDYCRSVAGSLRDRLVMRWPFRRSLPLSGEEREIKFRRQRESAQFYMLAKLFIVDQVVEDTRCTYLFIIFSSSIVNGAFIFAGLAFFDGRYPKQ